MVENEYIDMIKGLNKGYIYILGEIMIIYEK